LIFRIKWIFSRSKRNTDFLFVCCENSPKPFWDWIRIQLLKVLFCFRTNFASFLRNNLPAYYLVRFVNRKQINGIIYENPQKHKTISLRNTQSCLIKFFVYEIISWGNLFQSAISALWNIPFISYNSYGIWLYTTFSARLIRIDILTRIFGNSYTLRFVYEITLQ
jgi:hypothetical protein